MKIKKPLEHANLESWEEVPWMQEFLTLKGDSRIWASSFFVRTIVAGLLSQLVSVLFIGLVILIKPEEEVAQILLQSGIIGSMIAYLIIIRASIIKRCHDFWSKWINEYIMLIPLLAIYIFSWIEIMLYIYFLYIWLRFGDLKANVYWPKKLY